MVARGRDAEGKPRTKAKTGCITCRIRKIKCDEDKPFCQKCVKTGRTCDGYESPFRVVTNQPAKSAHTGSDNLDGGLQLIRPPSTQVTLEDINLLNRYLSTKTLFNVKVPCDEEARQILQASLTDPPIRHAIVSLRALRQDLESSPDGPASLTQRTPTHNYGLQHYSMALRGLASQLSSPDSNGLRSALLCCQVLISIEQVRGNFGAMALHIIRGLNIMHEYRARPCFTALEELAPARHSQLPFLDVFIIKLFAAPCKFTELAATASGITPPPEQPMESRDLPKIAPNMRTEIVRIAHSTLNLLARVSQVEMVEDALELLSEKAVLLDSLQSWLGDLKCIQESRTQSFEPLHVSFMYLFHRILRRVLLGLLESSPDLDTKLQTDNERLQGIANEITERLRAHGMYGGSGRKDERMVEAKGQESALATPELTNQR